MSAVERSGGRAKRQELQSGRREMGVQVLACYGGRVRVDKNERKDARHRTVVDPGVHRAALNDDITGLQMHDLAAVELQVALSREQQCIIDRLGARARIR